MFWNKNRFNLSCTDWVKHMVAFEELAKEVVELQERVYELEEDNDRLIEQIEDLTSRDQIFKAGLGELTTPEIISVKYDPPCPQCGDDDHYNMIDGQPCSPTKIISSNDGMTCACSPIGQPHSDNCKGAGW